MQNGYRLFWNCLIKMEYNMVPEVEMAEDLIITQEKKNHLAYQPVISS